MKKIALTLALIGAAPLSFGGTNALNSDGYNNSLQQLSNSLGAPGAAGPQSIKNPALYPNQQAQNGQDGFDLNSSMFGMNGPLSLSSIYSSEYGFILNAQYTQAFGQSNAGSLEFDLGKNERRINGTWGLALSQRQRVKMTAEYLQQNIDFDFLSGDTHQWVGQQAYGGTYEYLLNNRFIQDLNVNSTYSTVKSKNLSDKVMPDDPDLINVRRIAGGTDKSLSAGMDFTPFSTTTLGLALDYDRLNYDIKYHNQYQQAKNVQGFGGTINLSQLITQHVKIQLGASDRKPYDSYNGEIDYLAHTHPGSQLSIGLTSMRTIGSAGLSNDTRFGLNMNYSWGGNSDAHPATYQLNQNDNHGVNAHEDLAEWASSPAVHRPQVFAVADQKLESRSGKTLNSALMNNAVSIYPVKGGNYQTADVTGVLSNQTLVQGNAVTDVVSTLPFLQTQSQNGLFNNLNPQINNAKVDKNKSGYSTTQTGTLTPFGKTIGLTLSENSKDQLVLSGTPNIAGTFYVKVYATDSLGDADTYAQVFKLTITKSAGTHFNPANLTNGILVAPTPVGAQNPSLWSFDINNADPVTGKNYVLDNNDKVLTGLTLKITGADASNFSINGGDTLRYTGSATVGTEKITLQACKGSNCTPKQAMQVNVSNPPSFKPGSINFTATYDPSSNFTFDLKPYIISQDPNVHLIEVGDNWKTSGFTTVNNGIDQGTVIAGAPSNAGIGGSNHILTLYLEAADNTGISKEEAVNITIDRAPTPIATSAENSVNVNQLGPEYQPSWMAFPTQVTYAIKSVTEQGGDNNPRQTQHFAISSGGVLTAPDFITGQAGQYTVIATGTNDAPHSKPHTLTWTVDVNEAPHVDPKIGTTISATSQQMVGSGVPILNPGYYNKSTGGSFSYTIEGSNSNCPGADPNNPGNIDIDLSKNPGVMIPSKAGTAVKWKDCYLKFDMQASNPAGKTDWVRYQVDFQ